MFSNDVLCSGFQLIGLFFSVFFNSGLNAAAVCAKLGIDLMMWCIDPMNLFNYFNVFCFSYQSVVPSLFINYPSHSSCLQANLHLSNDMTRFSPSNFSRIVCSFRLCISIDHNQYVV